VQRTPWWRLLFVVNRALEGECVGVGHAPGGTCFVGLSTSPYFNSCIPIYTAMKSLILALQFVVVVRPLYQDTFFPGMCDRVNVVSIGLAPEAVGKMLASTIIK